MKKNLIVSLLFMMVAIALNAQTGDKLETYRNTINQRAYKIVAVLGISDSAKFYRVRDVIAKQYFNLNDIYAIRDSSKKIIKTKFAGDKTALTQQLADVENKTTKSIDSLHPIYLQKLSSLLNDKQVEQVKDGMTYGVLPLTYKAYQAMIPTLTDPQKKQILDWLTEAREHAIDAESSEKKHAWFGKYKGRINNYLSAAGYDMKKEEGAWQERNKAKKS